MIEISKLIRQKLEEYSSQVAEMEDKFNQEKDQEEARLTKEAAESMKLLEEVKVETMLETINNDFLSGKGVLKSDKGIVEHKHFYQSSATGDNTRGSCWSEKVRHGVAYFELRWEDVDTTGDGARFFKVGVAKTSLDRFPCRRIIKVSSGDGLIFVQSFRMLDPDDFDKHELTAACNRNKYSTDMGGEAGMRVDPQGLEEGVEGLEEGIADAFFKQQKFSLSLIPFK